ncbi:hypothetical protein HZS_4408 [Henneguya salminicola]|nr:hypothetical protein HZS_4408 [Henneguya salminicola]
MEFDESHEITEISFEREWDLKLPQFVISKKKIKDNYLSRTSYITFVCENKRYGIPLINLIEMYIFECTPTYIDLSLLIGHTLPNVECCLTPEKSNQDYLVFNAFMNV